MATVVTKTIGPTGDYATLAAWIAACPADLVAADTVWRGEVQNTELTGDTTLLTISGKTVDSTRYVELTAAAGASFADNTNVRTNALRYNAANGASIRSSVGYAPVIKVEQNYTRISRLQIQGTATGGGAYCAVKAVGYSNVDIDKCVIESWSSSSPAGESGGVIALYGSGTRARNSAIISRSTATDNCLARISTGTALYNCSLVSIGATLSNGVIGDYGSATLRNCYIGGITTLLSGSTSFTAENSATSVTASGWSTVAMADAFESVTDGSHDLRLKSGPSLVDAGTTDSTYAANDISGLARSGSWDIGAWEYSGSGATNATATGATLTGTSSFTPGSATGGEVIDATATGATLTGTASLTAGSASGVVSGAFTSSPMYSSGILQASVALAWTWYPGAIGTAPTSALVHGTGSTSAAGTLTASGLPTGDGFLLAETAAGAIYYEDGTVA